MDIKVEEYIRDKYGEIHIVYKIEQDTVYCDKPEIENPPFDTYGCRYYENSADIVKHSPNIIDLIEVGDYVNGSKVHHIREDVDDYGNDFKEINIENYCMLNYYIREEDIKSIVTKEMMKNVMYEV